jgi:hypothetical protein
MLRDREAGRATLARDDFRDEIERHRMDLVRCVLEVVLDLRERLNA